MTIIVVEQKEALKGATIFRVWQDKRSGAIAVYISALPHSVPHVRADDSGLRYKLPPVIQKQLSLRIVNARESVWQPSGYVYMNAECPTIGYLHNIREPRSSPFK